MLSDRYSLSTAMWFCYGLGAVSLAAVFGMREPERHGHLAVKDLPANVVGESVAL